jgi:hypothetical protein
MLSEYGERTFGGAMAEQSAHLIELAERIGPRPATSDAEASTAEYITGVFGGRGLPVETQEFDTPRTYSWAYAVYHLLTIVAAVASRWYPWLALVLAAVVAFVMWRDLDTRWGLSSIMPKGPSQNVIARHVPKQRRGEAMRRVVIVAHYDSAKASLAFSPGLVKSFGFTFGLMKACTLWTPLLILVAALPYVKPYKLIPWYVVLAGAAYLLVPLFIHVHRELFMKATPGANDNASGVAVMLGIMERLVPEADAAVFDTGSLPRTEIRRHTEEEARAADVVPEDSVLSYAPVDAPHRPPFEEHDFDEVWSDERPATPARGQTSMSLPEEEDIDWVDSTRPGPVTAEPPGSPPATAAAEETVLPYAGAAEKPAPKRRGFLGRPRAKDAQKAPEVREWLGVDESFDAKVEGEKIGSWDQFEHDGDDDDIGWKGGGAGTGGIDDPDFAAEEAARIRKRVTTGVDHALLEKEVWFVATGAEEAGTRGMLALIGEHGDDLRDALIINLDNLGSGSLAWVTSEGMAKRYSSDRRLTGAARRVASENDWAIKGTAYRGLSTDATALLARRFKAMSVMAFDINGRLPNWHWRTDTAEEVQPENIELAVDFVTAIIKEL